jgi:signal transduction histidine kinase
MQEPPADKRLESVPLDPGRVEQILGNLLANALRYTPDGGQISLRLETTGSTAVLHVRDSGPGIPTEALPRLFERFYRADKSRSRQEGGSGLGLPIARQLAQAHGGELAARNHPQGGAEFTLTLPLAAR